MYQMRTRLECFQVLDPGDTRWWRNLQNILLTTAIRCVIAVFRKWWDGDTYFDLGGREQAEFERAVAATRKGKPVRNKSEAKKEVKPKASSLRPRKTRRRSPEQ